MLDSLRIGQNVKEIIECDLTTEISGRTLYQEAATHRHGVKDYVSRDLSATVTVRIALGPVVAAARDQAVDH